MLYYKQKGRIMFKTIKNIGCLAIIGLAGWFFYGIYSGMENSRTAQTAKADSDPNTPPDSAVIELMFNKADREHLREKYGPKANVDKSGTPRVGNHRDGWFYVREYTGHDELGRMVQGFSGLLYKTNAATAWTYYDQSTLPDILPEVTVNGKPLSDLIKK